jgi:hypothetical protein
LCPIAVAVLNLFSEIADGKYGLANAMPLEKLKLVPEKRMPSDFNK